MFATTRDKIFACGKEVFGKGITSFIENLIGGTLSSLGIVSGGIAVFIDSVTKNKYTSSELKLRAATEKKPAYDVVEGINLKRSSYGEQWFMVYWVHWGILIVV